MSSTKLSSGCLNNAESLYYSPEGYAFFLLFKEKPQADKAAEFLISNFGEDEVALLFHYDDEAIDVEISTLDSKKSATIQGIKPFDNHPQSLENVKALFNHPTFGKSMRDKLVLMTAIFKQDGKHLQFILSGYGESIGIENIQYISVDRI